MTTQVKIDDIKVREMLDHLRKSGYTKKAAMMIATRIHEIIAPYPPAQGQKKAKGKTHYQRGLGSIYTRMKGGRTVYKTSQMTGRKWDIVEIGDGARLRNTSTYSGYLHDEETQAKLHKNRGWKTWQDALEKMQSSGEIDSIIGELYDNIL